MESAAVSILLRAVEMDTKERYTMALVLYQEGLQILMDLLKGMCKIELERFFQKKDKTKNETRHYELDSNHKDCLSVD